MDLLERYLQAVGPFLPAASRADTIAELRANLEEQMDGRAEELRRPLNTGDVADVLQTHGRPEVVAARYLPQRSLIGPGLFPIYALTLRRAVGYVALVYAVVKGITIVWTPSGDPLSQEIVGAVLGIFPVLLYFWGAVTLVFVALEFAQTHYGVMARSDPWDATKLPPLKPETGPAKPRSRSSRVAEVVVHCLWMVYVLAIPWHPYLIAGPAIPYLRSIGVRLAPVWHVFYVFVVVILVLQLAVKVLALRPGRQVWILALGSVRHLVDIGAFGMMVYAGEYLHPANAGANLERIAQVNQAIGVAVRLALFFAVLGLFVETWKGIKGLGSKERIPVGTSH